MDFKKQVEILVQKALDENPSLFLIDFHLGLNHSIKVVLDGDKGVSLQECMRVSRAVEHNLDRETQDFSIEVTSAGVGEPLLLPRQYINNVGRKLEVTDSEGSVYTGTLDSVNQAGLCLSWKQREPKPVGKGKVTVKKTKEFNKFLEKNKFSNVLIISDKDSMKNINKSARNIKNVKLIKEEGTNIYDLFKYKNVIITSTSAKKIQERVLNEKN